MVTVKLSHFNAGDSRLNAWRHTLGSGYFKCQTVPFPDKTRVGGACIAPGFFCRCGHQVEHQPRCIRSWVPPTRTFFLTLCSFTLGTFCPAGLGKRSLGRGDDLTNFPRSFWLFFFKHTLYANRPAPSLDIATLGSRVRSLCNVVARNLFFKFIWSRMSAPHVINQGEGMWTNPLELLSSFFLPIT